MFVVLAILKAILLSFSRYTYHSCLDGQAPKYLDPHLFELPWRKIELCNKNLTNQDAWTQSPRHEEKIITTIQIEEFVSLLKIIKTESHGNGNETQRFILVWGTGRAKPYSSGAAALVFVCSITGVVAHSYVVDWNGGRWIPSPRSLPSFI